MARLVPLSAAAARAGPAALVIALLWTGGARQAGAEPSHVRLVKKTRVYERRSAKPRYRRGSLPRDGRFRVLARRRPGRGCPSAWLRIGRAAWICSRYAKPANRRPRPAAPHRPLLPFRYIVTRDGQAFATLRGAVAGEGGRPLPGLGGYVYTVVRRRGGVRYYKTEVGWISGAHSQVAAGHRFRGVRLSRADRNRRLAFVKAAPAQLYSAAARPLDLPRLPRHRFLGQVGPPIEGGGVTLYRTAGGGYVRDRDIGLVEFAPPPPRASGSRWIDVSREQSTLVAYDGDEPVYATLVATGGTDTPTGEFQLLNKRLHARLRSLPGSADPWDVHTPWVMGLGDRIALHAVYWHADFGSPRSHGCINLAPRDAQWLWNWTWPSLPAGWQSIRPRDDERSTLVRIRP